MEVTQVGGDENRYFDSYFSTWLKHFLPEKVGHIKRQFVQIYHSLKTFYVLK